MAGIYGDEKPAKGAWQKLFDYNYLGTEILEGVSELHLTIESITETSNAKVMGQIQSATLVRFEEKELTRNGVPLILNKTNAKMLKKLMGNPADFVIEDAVGLTIILTQEYVRTPNGKDWALRIAKYLPNQKKEALTKDHANWGKCVEYLKEKPGDLSTLRIKYRISSSVEQLLISESK